jgi:trehalose 6-phosphate phosphatase
VPIATSFNKRSRATGGDTTRDDCGEGERPVSEATAGSAVAELVAPIRAEPAASALLLDIDGTLAPIVPDPEDAAVPPETREVLRALAARYALVACVTGRRALEARWIVGVEELVYSGNHGLELLRPGATEPDLDASVARDARRTREFVGDLDAEDVSAAGLRLESKGPIQALHWRGAADEAAAQGLAERIAGSARGAGLVPHWGRKVLEIRPVAGIDKGTAVDRLLGERDLRIALFGGDDRGDLAAFDALDRLVETGTLASAVRIAVASDEGPAELAERADVVVNGPEGFFEVLTLLADPAGASGD